MSLIDDLTTLSNNAYEDDAGAWRTYVIDHIPQIQQNSNRAMVDVTYIDLHRYDIEWFLREQSIGPELAWIFRLINNIPSGLAFRNEGIYYLPSAAYIDELHEKYMATTTARNG